jgi:hypothetical protein
VEKMMKSAHPIGQSNNVDHDALDRFYRGLQVSDKVFDPWVDLLREKYESKESGLSVRGSEMTKFLMHGSTKLTKNKVRTTHALSYWTHSNSTQEVEIVISCILLMTHYLLAITPIETSHPTCFLGKIPSALDRSGHRHGEGGDSTLRQCIYGLW